MVEGIKYDQEKIRFSLLPWRSVQEIIKVLMHGANKYNDFNWKKVSPLKERYFNAALRHLIAWWDGENTDSESGSPHLAHALCCLIFLLEDYLDDKSDG